MSQRIRGACAIFQESRKCRFVRPDSTLAIKKSINSRPCRAARCIYRSPLNTKDLSIKSAYPRSADGFADNKPPVFILGPILGVWFVGDSRPTNRANETHLFGQNLLAPVHIEGSLEGGLSRLHLLPFDSELARAAHAVPVLAVSLVILQQDDEPVITASRTARRLPLVGLRARRPRARVARLGSAHVFVLIRGAHGAASACRRSARTSLLSDLDSSRSSRSLAGGNRSGDPGPG